ncbi:hypothetical protein BDZ45DRAFT_393560 [Acephala macrosclerotiorum]|nr:hypothetical protein BDZ45DRAFT_393560 [Acephala macrosclerotiorum]
MNQQQPPEPDHYSILGVDPKATQTEIKKAYHKSALNNHPDKTGAASGEAFVKIKAAYDILSNENSRILYDAKRRNQQQTPASWTYRDPNAKPYGGAFNHNRPTPEQSYPFANFAKTYEEAMRAAEEEQQARAAEARKRKEEKLRKDNEERRAKHEAQEKARRELEEQRRKVKEMQAELNSQAAASRARAAQRAAAQESLAAEEQRQRQQAREEEAKKGPQPAKWATDWASDWASKVVEESRLRQEGQAKEPKRSGSWHWDSARVAEEKAANEEILRRMKGEGVGAATIDEKLRKPQEETAARVSEDFKPRQETESKKEPEPTRSWNWNTAGAADQSASTEEILRKWREEIAAANEERERKIKQQTADANSCKAAEQARASQEQAAGERLAKEYQNTARPPPTEPKVDRKRTRSGGPAEHTGSTPEEQPSRKRSTAPPFDDKRARFEKERQEKEGRGQSRQEKERMGVQQPGTQKPCAECVHNRATIGSLKNIIERQKIELQEMKTKYDALLRAKQPPMPGSFPETPQQYDPEVDDEKSTDSSRSDIDSEILEKAKPSGASTSTSSNESPSEQPKPFGIFTSGNESPFARAAKEHATNGGVPLFAKLNKADVPQFRGHSRNGGVDLLYCGRCGKNVDHRFTGCDEEEL